MEGEQKADCQQPDGNAETSVKPTGEDVTEQNPSTSQTLGSEGEEVVNYIKVGKNEGSAATDGTNSNKEEGLMSQEEPAEDNGALGVTATPTDGESSKTLGNEETPGDLKSQEDPSKEEKEEENELIKKDVKTICSAATQADPAQDTGALGVTATPTDGESSKTLGNEETPGDLKSQEDPSKEEKEEENELIKKDVKTICSAATQADPAQDTGALGVTATPTDGESSKTLGNEETPGDLKSQEDPSKEEKEEENELIKKDVKTICSAATQADPAQDTGALGVTATPTDGESSKTLGNEETPGDLKSQEDPSKEEKEEENELIKKDVKTICSAATQADPAQDTGALGDVDLAKGDSLLTMDKNSCQSVIDESQDSSKGNLLKEEESTDGKRTSHMSQEEPGQNEDIETIGPITRAEPSADTGTIGGGLKLLMSVALVALVAILVQHLLQPKPTIQKKDLPKVDIFLKQMEKVKTRFPNQRAELWSRSVIHLKRHLQTSQPTEPVSLILTSGFRAENTMRCLAQDVASAFSAALNASVLHIDGASTASQDSDQVKLDIDRKLQGAFEGDKPVAVIHRLEELPPGSTLIFYRYCDHETAAYKNTLLIFTVLLGEEEEIPAEMRLSIVEEMVDDYLKKRFLSHGQPVSFNRMDLNKYGGLWSRISHLILPVVVEERIEHKGC